jgi:hypothetical protein
MLGFTLFLFLIFGFSQPSEARSDAALSLPIPYPTQPDVSPTDFWHTSRYLTMRDGVKIAIDLYLPKQHQESKEFPAILHQTRYWRSVDYRWPVSVLKGKRPRGLIDTYAKRFLANGYAWVDMDVRGSGASFGSRRYAYSPEEIRDGNEVVDWIIQQPWSNGKVGALGISYGGTAAELLLVNQHPAVKAVAPLFSGFDLYSEIVFPGGIHLTWFTKTWSFITNQLDHNDLPYANWFTNLFVRGVLPINGDSNQTLLKQAIQEHEHNWNPHQEALGITFRDDVPPSQVTTSLDLLSPQTFGPEIAKSGAAIYSYSGWFDGAYQLAAIKRHWTHQNHANKLILGPWDHGGKRNISPFNLSPSQFDHQGELLKFFDFHLKGWNTSIIHERPVHYFTMGEERWKATDSWPPPSSQLAFYLAPQRTLTEDFPTTPLPPRSLPG